MTQARRTEILKFATGLMLCISFAISTSAQERVSHIFLGMPVGIGGERGADLQPRPGFAIGLDYWIFNAQGNAWSLGAVYSSFNRKNKDRKETFEYLTIHGMPIVWNLDKKKQWYFEIGLFGNYLLHQEAQEGGSVMDMTKSLQRIYFGPSAGFGVRIGQAGQSRILIGLRNDYGLLGVGAGTSLKFNTLTFFAGLEI